MKHDQVVYLEITTWQGLSVGAIHYYGKLRGDCKGKYKVIELQKVCTKQDAIATNKYRRENGFCSLSYMKPGNLIDGFSSQEEIRKTALGCFKEHFPNATILVEGRSSVADPQSILYGPKDVKDKVNKLVQEAEKINWWDNDEKKMQKIWNRWNKILKLY